jgi:hydroxyethylthiazole kinase-like uncharacterized protein yjeF
MPDFVPALPTAAVLLTTAEMAEADRRTIVAGTPGIQLMENAGAAVADVVLGLAQGRRRVNIFCGPGNNGGDGLVAARLLRDHGMEARVGLLQARRFKGDAALAADRFGGPYVTLSELAPKAGELVVDALFGAGLARPLEGAAAAAVEAINRSQAVVVAVDIPSGVEGNTGAVLGVAVNANVTVTFFRRKPGHLLAPGRFQCGEISVADIGIKDDVLAELRPQVFAAEPALWQSLLPHPNPAGHKYDRGHVLVLSGDLNHTGAARLAARAALRSGAGLVSVGSPAAALMVNAAHLTAIMLVQADNPAELAEVLSDPRKNAVVIGPALGVGSRTRAMVETALRAAGPQRRFVLDADALTSFAGLSSNFAELIQAAPGPVTLTPHEGEFARLFEISASPSKLARAGVAAAACRATIVLKGPDTVIAHPDGRAAIQSAAPPDLATAGSGDVLSGVIAGFNAQGMPPFEAAAGATYVHAQAGAAFGPGLIAEDLPELIPRVLAALQHGARASLHD